MKGIMFNENYGLCSLTALGIKTQTRRAGGLNRININPDSFERCRMVTWLDSGKKMFQFYHNKLRMPICITPRLQPSDVVYIKETYAIENSGGKPLVFYKTSGNTDQNLRWENKMFMPKAYARNFVRILSVKVDRLQNITTKDCLAEGIQRDQATKKYFYSKMDVKVFFDTAKEAYFSLYKTINKNSPDNNPWVFIYDYKFVSPVLDKQK